MLIQFKNKTRKFFELSFMLLLFLAVNSATIANAGGGIDDPDVLDAEGEILRGFSYSAAQSIFRGLNLDHQ